MSNNSSDESSKNIAAAATGASSNPEQILQALFGKNPTAAARGKHDFWDTQPVPKDGQQFESGENGPIDTGKNVRQTPYNLAGPYEWVECDVLQDSVIEDVYNLLNQNYVEDDDAMFRFDYSREFLRWALTPPGFKKEWHLGVRVKETGKIVAFITAIPATMHVYKKQVEMVEINFLCVHKKLRSKRLAPVLIKEITRRVNLNDIWQAVYTAGVVLPRPVGKNRYWHRSLNPGKLVDIRFSHVPRNMTKASMIKLYKLPNESTISGLRPMEAKDVPQVCTLMSNYLEKFDLHVSMTEEETAHWLLPREGVITTYVVENPDNHKVTDFFSFYTLCSSVMGNPKYNSLKAAYSFYNVPTKTPLKDLMHAALITAHNNNFDVFNALDVMENGTIFKDLKFGIGDGNLQYYLYNWGCPEMPANKVGLVLL